MHRCMHAQVSSHSDVQRTSVLITRRNSRAARSKTYKPHSPCLLHPWGLQQMLHTFRDLVHALPQMHGMRTIVIEDVDGRSCRHSIQGSISIGIFGVGKIAEHSIVEGTVKTFAALPAVVERWRMPQPASPVQHPS